MFPVLSRNTLTQILKTKCMSVDVPNHVYLFQGAI